MNEWTPRERSLWRHVQRMERKNIKMKAEQIGREMTPVIFALEYHQ